MNPTFAVLQSGGLRPRFAVKLSQNFRELLRTKLGKFLGHLFSPGSVKSVRLRFDSEDDFLCSGEGGKSVAAVAEGGNWLGEGVKVVKW